MVNRISYKAIKDWLRSNPLEAFAVTNIAADALIIASGMINGELRDIPAFLGILGNGYALIRSQEKSQIVESFNEEASFRQIAADCAAALREVTMSFLKSPAVLTRDVVPALRGMTAQQVASQFRKAVSFRGRDNIKESLFALVGVCGVLYAASGITSSPPRWLETFAGISLAAGSGITWLGQNARLGSQFFMAGTGAMLYSSLEPAVRTGLANGSIVEGLAALDPFVLTACCIFAGANHMMGKIRMRSGACPPEP